jgi:AcrR family transcriptional regulator
MQASLHVKTLVAVVPASNVNGMPRKYSMETRNEEGALLRRRVMDAAFEVLGEVGAERLTMDMVATRADAATRTVYNHFGSRQELLAAVYADILRTNRDILQRIVTDTGEPAERLRQFVTQLYAIYEERGAAFTTLIELDEPTVRARLRDMRTWRRERLTQILRPATKTLRLSLKQAAAFAFVSTNHATWRALREDAGLTQRQAIDTTTTVLEAALFDVSTNQVPDEPIGETAR